MNITWEVHSQPVYLHKEVTGRETVCCAITGYAQRETHEVSKLDLSWKIEGHTKPAETVETSGRTQVQRSKMDVKTSGFQTRQSQV